MHKKTQTSKFLVVPVFVAAMGVSPIILAQDTDQTVDDQSLATSVRAAIDVDPALQSTLVRVASDNGKVQLSGIVHTKSQEAEAVKVASQIEGVKSIDDNLEVSHAKE